MPVAIFDNS